MSQCRIQANLLILLWFNATLEKGATMRAIIVIFIFLIFATSSARSEFDPQPEDYIDGCTLDKIANCQFEVKFGSRDAVSTTEAPVWTGDASYRFVFNPQPLLLVSTSAEDTSAGTGARKVLIFGQANFEWISEEVTLNGLTPAVTTKSFDFIHRMYVTDAGVPLIDVNTAVEGSTGAVGFISATTQSSVDLLATIDPGANITQQAIVRVPNGEQWILHRIVTTGGANKEIILQYYVRWPGTNVFQSQGQVNVVEGSPVTKDHRLLPPGTDMIITAHTVVGMANTSIQVQFMRFGVDRFPTPIPRSINEM